MYNKKLADISKIEPGDPLSGHIKVFKDGEELKFITKLYRGECGKWIACQAKHEDGKIVETEDGEYHGVLHRHVFDIDVAVSDDFK